MKKSGDGLISTNFKAYVIYVTLALAGLTKPNNFGIKRAFLANNTRSKFHST